MKKNFDIPEFVVAGHPNEGKSSVLSTLSEDDSVRISPVPGETKSCRTFPLILDNREIMRFVDTPGFQNPRATLKWMREYRGDDRMLIPAFLEAHRGNPRFRDDCELLAPMAGASGIIFVVDGSRPMRNVDRAEMEILRLTGKPRMAVLNCKDTETAWLSEWQSEFRKHFNIIRVFNSCRATFAERIRLLESIKSIDQELEPGLSAVISALDMDWSARNRRTAELVVFMLTDIAGWKAEVRLRDGQQADKIREKLVARYRSFARKREKAAFDQIRRLFRHRRLDLKLPGQEAIDHDLFSRKTWEFLGLSRKQLIMAGFAGGAAIGAGIDLGHGGLSMGLFGAAGGILGAAGAAFRAKSLLEGRKIMGVRLDRETLHAGPAASPQLLFVLVDRAIIFYNCVTNWAHGRRDYENMEEAVEFFKKHTSCLTSTWSQRQRDELHRLYRAISEDNVEELQKTQARLAESLTALLENLSRHDARPV